MTYGSSEFLPIAELITELNALTNLLYGAGKETGLIADLKSSNAEFTDRVEQIRSLMEGASKALAEAAGGHVVLLGEQIEQLKEAATILDTIIDHFDPSVYAESCLAILEPRLVQPMVQAIESAHASQVKKLADTLAPVVLEQLREGVHEVVVLRREEIVREVAAIAMGEMQELHASEVLREFQENYRVLHEKNKRLFLFSCAGSVGCLLLTFIVFLR